MNINCIICSDLFVPTSVIFVTRCGHTFHYTCLIQWIERSKTCPQCRNKINEKSIFRIFFNILTLEGVEDDAVTLQSKLDAANLQLRLKENHVKSTDDKFETISAEKAILEDKYNVLQKETAKIKAGFASLKDQINFHKEKSKYVEKVEAEITLLKESMKRKDQAMKAITGSVDEATDIIHSSACPKTLSVIATTLKKELQLVEKKKNNYFTTMKRAENELHSRRKEVESLNLECDKLKRELVAHQQCEREMQSLKEKIAEMMESSTAVDPSLVRVVTESPAPSKIRSKLSGVSPSIAERVQEIKDSDSPYLKIKSNNMGLLFKSQESGQRFGSNNISIFKKALLSSTIDDITTIKKPLADYSYDGFGGHSKDERFPVPRPTTTGIKRTKSSMSSSKFRKLSKPNKKLDDFLDLSTTD